MIERINILAIYRDSRRDSRPFRTADGQVIPLETFKRKLRDASGVHLVRLRFPKTP